MTPNLVTGLFLRTVYTGLGDLAIRQEFRPYLDNKDITDEELIHGLNQIDSKENERKSKFGKSVKSVTVDVNSLAVDHEGKDKSVPKEGVLVSEVRALKAEVAELRTLMQNMCKTCAEGATQAWLYCLPAGRHW